MMQWGHCVLTNKRIAPILSGQTHFELAASQVGSFEEKTCMPCQLSRFDRETHGLLYQLTFSRFGPKISR